MEEKKVYRAIGLMSGTSLDGIDAAIIETDGYGYVKPMRYEVMPYTEELRERIRKVLGQAEYDPQLEQDITQAHIDLLKKINWKADVVGFHGQTIFHDPANKLTVQVGDGALMAQELGFNVVNDFRSADVAAGGQGAPFLPLYHQARSASLPKPIAVLNMGGVANVTWIDEDYILAFDTGPGNALIDDFVKERTGQLYDQDGALAYEGHSVDYLLEEWYGHPYFDQKPPKSLDRDEWDLAGLEGLSDQDGAATLTVFTAEAIIASQQHMPQEPKAWYVAGGGRKNKTLMRYLQAHLKDVQPVENIGWNGDALEAEGFAYLAVRSLLGEPLSLPDTTGVPAPQIGGVLHKSS